MHTGWAASPALGIPIVLVAPGNRMLIFWGGGGISLRLESFRNFTQQTQSILCGVLKNLDLGRRPQPSKPQSALLSKPFRNTLAKHCPDWQLCGTARHPAQTPQWGIKGAFGEGAKLKGAK